LNLRHDLYWYWPYLYFRVELTHQAIHYIQDLVAQARLTDRSCTRCNHERPEDRGSDNADSSDGGLIHPFLLANHRQCATAGALQNHGQGGLQADQGFEITALFQLHHHLVIRAEMLGLEALRPVDVFQIAGQLL
jgi:hypothetical protein